MKPVTINIKSRHFLMVFKSKLAFRANRSMFFIFYLLLAVGCQQDDFFERERPTEPPWLDVTTFDYAVLGIYNEIAHEGFSKKFYHGKIFYTTVLSDEMGLCPYHAGVHVEQREIYPRPVESNGKLPPVKDIGNVTTFKNSYDGIALANKALEFYYNFDKKPFGVLGKKDQDNLERIVGELHFLRAAMYFELAKLYLPWYKPDGDNSNGQLPFYETTPKSIDEAKSSGLVNTGEIYEWIKKELKIAISLMPEQFDPSVHPVTAKYGRAYKPVARGMLARVQFAMHEWDEAVAQIDSIEATGLFRVDEDILRPWTAAGQLYGEKSPEVLWYLVFDNPTLWHAGFGAMSLLSWNNMVSTEGGGRVLPAGIYDPDTQGQGMSAYGHPYYISNASLKEFGWVKPDGTRYPYPDVFGIINDKRFRNLVVPHQGYLSENVMKEVAGDPNHPYRTLFRRETLDLLDAYKDSNFGILERIKLKDELQHYAIWEPRHPDVDTNKYMVPFKCFRVPTVDGSLYQGNANFNLMRWPELLLTRAIIYNMGGNGVAANPGKAAIDVNAVKSMRMNDFEPKSSYSNEEIHTERKIELLAEGDRLDYLRSLQLPIPPGDRIPVGTATEEKEEWNETPSDRLTISPPYDGFFWEVPPEEIDANKAFN